MRIVSQNGDYDFPYERCTLWVINNRIIATLIGEPETDAVMAEYSSNEKTKNAMQKLCDAYVRIWAIEHGIGIYTDDISMVFKFPSDDENEGG